MRLRLLIRTVIKLINDTDDNSRCMINIDLELVMHGRGCNRCRAKYSADMIQQNKKERSMRHGNEGFMQRELVTFSVEGPAA